MIACLLAFAQAPRSQVNRERLDLVSVGGVSMPELSRAASAACPATFSNGPGYAPMEKVAYCTAGGKELTLNVFRPIGASWPTPAMVEIHGGWFVGGEPATQVPGFISSRKAAFFSVAYRLGADGGFPQCIRDCRNAIRFIRKNATRFNVDPDRIAVMGGSAGGHLSLMVGMAPEDFNDGGPTQGLEGVSARVCGVFSWIPPTDFLRFWNQGPSDETVAPDGTKTYRSWDDRIANDARPHLRALFHGVSPDTEEGRAVYRKMCPLGQVRPGLPPVLVCDGLTDPIVPGQMGRDLVDRIKAVGGEATYYLSLGGHEFPSGPGFEDLLGRFLDRLFGRSTPEGPAHRRSAFQRSSTRSPFLPG